MYYILKSQEKIIKRAIKNAGSYRKLSQKIKIPSSSIHRYFRGGAIPEKNLKKIINLLLIKKDVIIKRELPKNFKQIIGGKKSVKLKKKSGIYEDHLKVMRKKSSSKLKKWHKEMKEKHPEEYYAIQYSRFKKIGGYKYKTKKGEKVRNLFEKKLQTY